MKLSNILLAVFLLFTSCRVKRDVQLENIKTAYVQKFDFNELDSSVEYLEIERIYTYTPAADSGIDETSFHVKPTVTISEKIKSYKKTGSSTSVQKQVEAKSEEKTKVTTKEKQSGTSLIFPVMIIIIALIVFKFRKS